MIILLQQIFEMYFFAEKRILSLSGHIYLKMVRHM